MTFNKDLNTRVTEIIGAWEKMRPGKSFFGLTLDGFKLKANGELYRRWGTAGLIHPHDFIYVPALLAVIVAGGYVDGTIFSLQSDGVYALQIRADQATANAEDARLAGI